MIFKRKILSADDAWVGARKVLPNLVFDYFDGAAGREATCRKNCAAFEDVELQPRALVDVSERHLKTKIFGQTFDHPFGIAPMGMCNLAWPGADQMLARAATTFNIPHCLSTAASSSIEDLVGWAGARAWFQLYVGGSVAQSMTLVDRAEAAGYDTLILTVDVPQVARRLRDVHNGFQMPFVIGPKQFLDFALHPRWALTSLARGAPKPANFLDKNGNSTFDRGASRAGADWNFLAQLRARWKGTLIVKGVMSVDDATRIRETGVDGIYVSNHGGRQLGSAPPALNMLRKIRAKLGPEFPLIFDSGVRNGEDVVKALALGADFVMLGRPLLFALAADQERGLSDYLASLSEDVSLTLAQIGLCDVGDLGAEVLV